MYVSIQVLHQISALIYLSASLCPISSLSWNILLSSPSISFHFLPRDSVCLSSLTLLSPAAEQKQNESNYSHRPASQPAPPGRVSYFCKHWSHHITPLLTLLTRPPLISFYIWWLSQYNITTSHHTSLLPSCFQWGEKVWPVQFSSVSNIEMRMRGGWQSLCSGDSGNVSQPDVSRQNTKESLHSPQSTVLADLVVGGEEGSPGQVQPCS